MSGLLEGARGLVLGVSGERSIGHAVARAAHEQGAEVALSCRGERLPAVRALAERLGAPPPLALEADDDASIATAIAAAAGAPERLDFVVHTLMPVPGAPLARPLLELARADFDRVLGPAAYSLIATARHAAPFFARSTAPRLVALTSACSRRPAPGYHVAGIAKAALEAAVLYLARELGPAGVLVNAVSPGFIATDGALRVVGAQAAAAAEAAQAKRAFTRRATSLADVAGTVVFLASPFARNLTGEVVAIDGGYARGYG